MQPSVPSVLQRLWPSLVLGLVQGITEFLPVSSSGHLVLGQHMLGFVPPSLLFDITLHVGTLVPVLWLYRVDLYQILRGLGGLAHPRQAWREDRGFRVMLCVVLGTIPTAIIGATLNDLFERLFSSPMVVGVMFLVTGGILTLSRLSRSQISDEEPEDSHLTLTVLRALGVGLAQGVAITPGISRSGTTITAALLLGVERTMAARFSFLLAIPAILGAVALHLRHGEMVGGTQLLIYGAGALMAAVSGYLALRWLVGLVRRGALHRFAYYLWPLGLAALAHALLT